MNRLAFSYIRFSTPEQIKGDSLRRQSQLAEAYCAQHNLTLDTTLTMTDLGISAFKGGNLEGALGGFITAIDDGRVPPGSVLLVESLDRLSRDQVLTALSTFQRIIGKNIDIVTLSDNRSYTKDNINDISNILMSILTMARAHEESLMKSKRVSAAWDNKRNNANNKILTSLVPAWLEVQNNQIVPIPDKVEIVKRIFEMCISGYGIRKITTTLNEDGIPTLGNRAEGWHNNTVQTILTSDAVLGTLHTNKAGEKQPPIFNYYPQVISDEVYNAAKLAMKSRKNRSGKISDFVNIFAGLIKCRQCGGSATMVNKTKKRVIYCERRRRSLSKDDACAGGINYSEVQKRVLDNLITPYVIAKLYVDNKEEQAIQAKIDALNLEIADINNQLRNIALTISQGGDFSIFKDVMAELDGNKKGVQSKIDEHQIALNRLASNRLNFNADIEMLAQMATGEEVDFIRVREIMRNRLDKIEIVFSTKAIYITHNHGTEFI